ncbi:MAG: TldD/PmbA family protein [Roseburia sp.]|nr:TldD/PmbA family protein [Roseburia sp.]
MERTTAKKVLDIALSTGADFAELYVQDKTERAVELNYKRVDNVACNLIYGAGIRLMSGVRQVYGYTSDISEKSLCSLAEKLCASFDGARVLEVGKFKEVADPSKHAPAKEPTSMTTEAKIEYLKKGEAAMYAVSPLIVNARCVARESDETVEIFTVKKDVCRAVRDRRVHTRIVAMATAARDGAFEVGSFSPGLSKGAELYDEVDFVTGAKQAAEDAVALLDAPECPSGVMPVVIGNAFGGVLFHEACGHPLEGTAISHNMSPFAGKLGQKVASELVTAVDDGTREHGWGSESFDDEGEPSTKNVLIENGVLKSYMMDTFDGRRMGAAPTGACRRESYKYLPTTRMTNTYIAAGNSTPEEIIKATKKGIYCVAFNGGSVDPTTDKFNFTSSKTYVIKDGKLDKLVKSPCLVGFGYEILPKIDMVGNDLELSAGTCGAASGMISAAVGQPTLRVSEMTVGGKGDTL